MTVEKVKFVRTGVSITVTVCGIPSEERKKSIIYRASVGFGSNLLSGMWRSVGPISVIGE